MVSSASSAYVIRSFENTFKAGGTVEHSFGFDSKISGLEWSNNQVSLPQLYTPEVEAFLYGKNSGACTIEYTTNSIFFSPYKTFFTEKILVLVLLNTL